MADVCEIQQMIMKNPTCYRVEYNRLRKKIELLASLARLCQNVDCTGVAETISMLITCSKIYADERGLAQVLLGLWQNGVKQISIPIRRLIVRGLISLSADDETFADIFLFVRDNVPYLPSSLQSELISVFKKSGGQNAVLKKNVLKSASEKRDDSALFTYKLIFEMVDKEIWTDEETISAVIGGMVSDNQKISRLCMHFANGDMDDLEKIVIEKSISESDRELRSISFSLRVGRKTSHKKRAKERHLQKHRELVAAHEEENGTIVLYDLADRKQVKHVTKELVRRLKNGEGTLEHRISMLATAARFMRVHKINIKGYIPILRRYTRPDFVYCNKILAVLVDAIVSATLDEVSSLVSTVMDTYCSHDNDESAVIRGLNMLFNAIKARPAIRTLPIFQNIERMKGNRYLGQAYKRISSAIRRKWDEEDEEEDFCDTDAIEHGAECLTREEYSAKQRELKKETATEEKRLRKEEKQRKPTSNKQKRKMNKMLLFTNKRRKNK